MGCKCWWCGLSRFQLGQIEKYTVSYQIGKFLIINNGHHNHLSSHHLLLLLYLSLQLTPTMAGITTAKLSLSPSIRSSSSSFLAYPSFNVLRHSIALPRRCKFSKIYALSSNDIKVGTSIEVDGAPWKVLEFLHVKPGKGAAFVRTKMRNYITGNTVEKTFRAGATIPEANVSKETKQFTYKDGTMYVFMDLSSYEEFRLNESDIGDSTKWLKEGMDCNLQFWNGKAIDIELPVSVKLTVVDTDPGLKGDTAQGGTKVATLETGAVVNVPLFTKIGDQIMVDTRTGQYTSRGH